MDLQGNQEAEFHEDIFGLAVSNYFLRKDTSPIEVYTDVTDPDEIPPSYLFRKYTDMPKLEQIALSNCEGNILDVGACAGPHASYLINKGFNVKAIETSAKSVQTLIKLGIDAEQISFYEAKGKYDTVLMLMNGIGIAGSLANLPVFFKQLKGLINKEGQALIDSSDLIYLFDDINAKLSKQIQREYYGEISYKLKYKHYIGRKFNWLFLDARRMEQHAQLAGLKFELIYSGENHHFLARLTHLDQ